MNPGNATIAFDFQNINVSVDFIFVEDEYDLIGKNKYKITYDDFTVEFTGKKYYSYDSIDCSPVHQHTFTLALNNIKTNMPRIKKFIERFGDTDGCDCFRFLDRDCISFIKYGQYVAVSYDTDSEDGYGSDAE